MIDALRLAAGWALPWLLGIALVASLRDRADRAQPAGEAAWTVGCGFFVGAFVLTLWMRALSMLGLRFSVAAVSLPLAVAALALGALAWRGQRRSNPLRAPGESPRAPASRAVRVLWFGIASWMALRFVLLLLEVLWIPLYPWDAWVQWATKARVWYAMGRMVPFVHSDPWFAANGAAWFDAAPNYPATMPLWQVWSSLALGRWDDALMNLPWWLVAVALAIAVYGLLRASGVSALTAIVGAWLVSSLPLANVHVALAGYADLPMAAYYALAALALWRWTLSRRWPEAALALLLALACPTIKTPGIVWALTLVAAAMVALWPRRGPRLVGIGLATALFALLVLARTHPVILGYRLHLDFAPAWEGLVDSFFLLGNWHLLWYAAIACAIVAWRDLRSPRLLPLGVTIGAGFAFLAVVFAFTNARNWVSTQTTINRAVLHIAPLVAVWTVLVASQWLERNRARPDAAPALPERGPDQIMSASLHGP
ncbi:MAG: hypothetical protein KGL70_07770 [Betaproteobacteria bacterium]|nr:hypothetical protein [Betaproteobacteria bacterium]